MKHARTVSETPFVVYHPPTLIPLRTSCGTAAILAHRQQCQPPHPLDTTPQMLTEQQSSQTVVSHAAAITPPPSVATSLAGGTAGVIAGSDISPPCVFAHPCHHPPSTAAPTTCDLSPVTKVFSKHPSISPAGGGGCYIVPSTVGPQVNCHIPGGMPVLLLISPGEKSIPPKKRKQGLSAIEEGAASAARQEGASLNTPRTRRRATDALRVPSMLAKIESGRKYMCTPNIDLNYALSAG